MSNAQITAKIRRWVEADTKDEEELIEALCQIIADIIANPEYESAWVKNCIEEL